MGGFSAGLPLGRSELRILSKRLRCSPNECHFVNCLLGSAAAPRNSMKMWLSRGRMYVARSGEAEWAVEMSRPFNCLVRSLLVERINGRPCSPWERR